MQFGFITPQQAIIPHGLDYREKSQKKKFALTPVGVVSK